MGTVSSTYGYCVKCNLMFILNQMLLVWEFYARERMCTFYSSHTKRKSSVTSYCHYFDIFRSKFNFKSDYACTLNYLVLTPLFQSDEYLFVHNSSYCDRITHFLWHTSLHVLMIRRSVNAIKPLLILYCIYKFCHNNSDQMFANFRRNEEEVVCCHSICGECEDGHFGRADGRGGSLLQEIYLGTAAQVQRG